VTSARGPIAIWIASVRAGRLVERNAFTTIGKPTRSYVPAGAPSAFGLTAGNGIHDGHRWSAATTRTRAVCTVGEPLICVRAPHTREILAPRQSKINVTVMPMTRLSAGCATNPLLLSRVVNSGRGFDHTTASAARDALAESDHAAAVSGVQWTVLVLGVDRSPAMPSPSAESCIAEGERQ
jgi:hypothetical protein